MRQAVSVFVVVVDISVGAIVKVVSLDDSLASLLLIKLHNTHTTTTTH